MSRYAQCDICGHKDDLCFAPGQPILGAGLVLMFRDDDKDFAGELDVCESCRWKILNAFPELKKALVEKGIKLEPMEPPT
jgi:hypothetical protein